MTNTKIYTLMCVLLVLSGLFLIPEWVGMVLSGPRAPIVGAPFVLLGVAGFIGIVLRPVILGGTTEVEGSDWNE